MLLILNHGGQNSFLRKIGTCIDDLEILVFHCKIQSNYVNEVRSQNDYSEDIKNVEKNGESHKKDSNFVRLTDSYCITIYNRQAVNTSNMRKVGRWLGLLPANKKQTIQN